MDLYLFQVSKEALQEQDSISARVGPLASKNLPRGDPFLSWIHRHVHSLALAGVPLMSLRMKDMLPTPWGTTERQRQAH